MSKRQFCPKAILRPGNLPAPREECEDAKVDWHCSGCTAAVMWGPSERIGHPPKGSQPGMKTKKPRSAKAVKPAARTIRRVAQTKPKARRPKPSPAKVKGGKGRTRKKPKLPAQGKTRTVAKTKTARKRVIRKPRAKVSPILVADEQSPAPVVAAHEQESEAIPSEQAQAAGSLDADHPEQETTLPASGLRIPPVLLEGDEPFSPPIGVPEQKHALGPTAPAGQFVPERAVLPEAYGTGKVWLAARDPHWLYAHWDLTLEQQQRHNALSADRHLVVRVYTGTIGAQPVTEAHVHPESRHWFIHVDQADTRYVAELGYYRSRHRWVAVAISPPALTPADTASTDQTVRFATIPSHVPLQQLAALAKRAVATDQPPADAAPEYAPAELGALELGRQDWAEPAGTPERVRDRGEEPISAAQLAYAAPLGGESGSLSSPMGIAEQRPGGFWLNVNTELVIYGATEPGASVTIGGRPITLRPDGTFSSRCSLPDGDHAVTVSAMSVEGELRQAALEFSRRTEYRGDVGAAPQDPLLEPPAAENP